MRSAPGFCSHRQRPTTSATPDHIGKTLAYVSVRVTLDALDGDIVSRGIGTYRIYTKSLVKSV